MKISMVIGDGAYVEGYGTFEYPTIPPIGTIIERGTDFVRVVRHNIILIETPVGYRASTSVLVEPLIK